MGITARASAVARPSPALRARALRRPPATAAPPFNPPGQGRAPGRGCLASPAYMRVRGALSFGGGLVALHRALRHCAARRLCRAALVVLPSLASARVCSCGAGRRSASRLPAAIEAGADPQRASPLAARPPPTDRGQVERKPAPRGRGRRERNQRRCQASGGSGFFASGRSLSIDKA